ncbi:neutral/alkaline non-lysosomal ceramidase N-terminal domain-containing protein [Lihuaxuella thermophila]|uniref:Neutral/alkaline non-lysosomal ceramidase, N-terminal n=1 Tax=Lihuaxuella thermophila TaxID=1173111 RepID=A0A1H8E1C7_9BACL|nr:neutral/alkaline non-lysosomal ceramidase N-terminal domain-containing protein [Lihuaxuella thermophila]SEN13391.1 Neutral/alkaline non-lysosomal ceramidase, N-terminal [Lihuaxuella thermophila]
MKPALLLGTAKIDITPQKPVPLAGFDGRQGNFLGILHPLYARIFFFQQHCPRGNKRTALLVSADIIWWDTELTGRIKRWLHQRFGMEASSVLLHATHTHSAPQTSRRFTPSLGKWDDDYLRLLEARLLEGIEQASSHMDPVSVERGTGECRIGVHRRKWVGGEMKMAPNEQEPVDPEVNVIRFCTVKGKTKALLVHYTCHPTTTEDNYVSSEFPGVAMERVEHALGEGGVAAFLQGCCGDVRPALIREGNFYRGNDSDVRRFGKILADEVLSVLQKTMRPLDSCGLVSRKTEILLPFQYLPKEHDLKKHKYDPSVLGEWSRLLLEEPARMKPGIRLEMALIRLAQGLSLLAMNGEIVTGYGLFIKREFDGSVLPVPYSNGMIGYVPTAKQVEEGGYEGKESFYYFGLPAPFHPSLETIICRAILDLGKE